MTLLNRIFCFSIWVFAAQIVSAQTLPIYVAPSTDHVPVARTSISGQAIAKATPVLEAAKKADGWFWAEYTGPFEGYVSSRDFGSGDRPRAGSIVYAEARLNSPVVTTVEEGDRGSLAERTSDGQFMRVSLNKTIGVYFNAKLSGVAPPKIEKAQIRRSTPYTYQAPAPVVQPPPVVASAPVVVQPKSEKVSPPPQPTPRATPPPQPKTPIRQTPPPEPATTPATPFVETPQPQVRPVVTPAPATRPRKVPEIQVNERKIPLPPVVIENSITLSGKLVQTKRRWLLIKPETDYMLIDAEGDRIAWIELDGAVLSRPLPDLLGTAVTVYGEWRKRDNDSRVILQARSLRLEL